MSKGLWILIWWSLILRATAGCCAPEPPEEAFERADVVAELSWDSREGYADGPRIRTRHEVRVWRVFKGELPGRITLDHPGGRLGGRVEQRSDVPDFPERGRRFIAHLSASGDGTWRADALRMRVLPGTPEEDAEWRRYFQSGARGGAPTSDAPRLELRARPAGEVPGSKVTPTGYLENSAGLPSRYTNADRGVAVPYLVDVDPSALPAGMSETEALEAVEDSFAAWSSTSSLTFRFEGVVSFGQSADQLAVRDGRIRVQLHDPGGSISDPGQLGFGGGYSDSGAPPADLSGGVLDGQGFRFRKGGYVVLNASSLTGFNEADYRELITHELGHALGLAHSSNDTNEDDPVLAEATMFAVAHRDGRGASLRAYDEDRIRFGYPEADTPPFAADRILRVVTGSPQPTGPGVDRIRVHAGDRQTPGALTIEHLAGEDAVPLDGASFELDGDEFICNVTTTYADSVLTPSQIAGGTYNARAYYRVSDGTHVSPVYSFRIIGTHEDSSPSDGLPDSWMSAHFGTTSPGSPGSARHPESDPDGDGIVNRVERYLASDPNDADSGPPAWSFAPEAGEVVLTPDDFVFYRLEVSDGLESWRVRGGSSSFELVGETGFRAPSGEVAEGPFYRLRYGP